MHANWTNPPCAVMLNLVPNVHIFVPLQWVLTVLITMFATLTLGLILLWVIQKSIEFYRNVKAVG